ncbi:CHC2 zinc finger domain-containing protein [Desulfosporosinus sp. SB140]|uniref:CHC2 zinc finger domain-containing protein n=1 Tax=Desulfosporosinus paludis TaxID=3115649 RepID=UPI00388F0890
MPEPGRIEAIKTNNSLYSSLPHNENIFDLAKQIPLEDVFRKYYTKDLTIHGNRIKAKCFQHGPDKHPSLTTKGDHWRCWTCGIGGDCIDLLSQLWGVSSLVAAKTICIDFGLIVEIGQPLSPEELKQIRVKQEKRKLEQLWRQGVNILFRAACDMKDALLTITLPDDSESIETLAQLENLIDVLIYGIFEDIMCVLKGGWYYGHTC